MGRFIRTSDHEKVILKEYLENKLSVPEIVVKHSISQKSIYNFLRKTGNVRTKSESAKLGLNKGDRPKNLEKLIKANQTYARFNPLKIVSGTRNGRWIADRTKVKRKRLFAEEQHFFKEVLRDRKYTCEITGEIGGKLSVHHLLNFSTHPKLRFDKSNVIVIKKELHQLFHSRYSNFNNTPEQFKEFVENYRKGV